jgi:hypothetical protein
MRLGTAVFYRMRAFVYVHIDLTRYNLRARDHRATVTRARGGGGGPVALCSAAESRPIIEILCLHSDGGRGGDSGGEAASLRGGRGYTF